jgi:hypothetical protein
MTAAALLELAIVALQHASDLQALYAKAAADGGRDLTPEEVSAVRATAQAAVDKFGADLA